MPLAQGCLLRVDSLGPNPEPFSWQSNTLTTKLSWTIVHSSRVKHGLSPSPGSTISTVAVSGNSSTAITGSDSWISKVSEISYSWSVKIFTFQVAVVCPGLNCTCFWAFPRKSLSFLAVPSLVAMPGVESWGKVEYLILLHLQLLHSAELCFLHHIFVFHYCYFVF